MIPRIEHELIIMSDIHIIHEQDERAELLKALLKSLDASSVKTVILLGDIFDFCLGPSTYFHRKFQSIGEELSALSRRGVEIFYVEGNHEFLIPYLPWKGVHFVRKGPLLKTLSDGKKLACIHGDFLFAKWHYRLYHRLVRSPLSRFFSLRVPQAKLDKFALSLSSASRKRSYKKAINMPQLDKSLSEFFSPLGVDYGVFGHFHIPYDAMHGERQRILCLESWDKPNVLAYSQGSFHRIYLNKTLAQSRFFRGGSSEYT